MKTFTHFPGAFERDGNVCARRPRRREPGERFIRKAVSLGIPTICTHKGLSLGNANVAPTTSASWRAGIRTCTSSRTARASRRASSKGRTRRRRNVGVNRLLASMERRIGPNENVFAEVGSSWWYLMRYPTRRPTSSGSC